MFVAQVNGLNIRPLTWLPIVVLRFVVRGVPYETNPHRNPFVPNAFRAWFVESWRCQLIKTRHSQSYPQSNRACWIFMSDQANAFVLERCDWYPRCCDRPSNYPGCIDRLARLSGLPIQITPWALETRWVVDTACYRITPTSKRAQELSGKDANFLVRIKPSHRDYSCLGLGNQVVYQPSCLRWLGWQIDTETVLRPMIITELLSNSVSVRERMSSVLCMLVDVMIFKKLGKICKLRRSRRSRKSEEAFRPSILCDRHCSDLQKNNFNLKETTHNDAKNGLTAHDWFHFSRVPSGRRCHRVFVNLTSHLDADCTNFDRCTYLHYLVFTGEYQASKLSLMRFFPTECAIPDHLKLHLVRHSWCRNALY
ncbi:hypothetical protein CLF_111440 [Clonorchis sinensis]|uniref:Uncharacterized protein n=1 Tax=Clonorchis sinensis TaxID=79923 RepID=G7YUW2_CLOSI|nr:hypothetical protein CLF_111440 [Clonorchis sinensis]